MVGRLSSTESNPGWRVILIASVAMTALPACFSGLGRSTSVDAGDGDAVVSESCGDGWIDDLEVCDDGNLRDGDGCDPTCQLEPGWWCEGEPSECVNHCGDDVLDPGEQCDGDDLDQMDCTTIDGGFTAGLLHCTAQCTFDTTECVAPGCGDGEVGGTEECDDGNTSNQDACLNNCHRAGCGDGYLWTGLEQCDDGNTSNQDDCLNTCRRASCGDGYPWLGHEECDDGDTTSGDGCTSTCVLEYCGDGVVQGGIGEECEGGARACTTTCNSTGQESCQASCKWGLCMPPSETCNGVDDDCTGTIDMVSCLNTVYRFYNPSTGDHMFKVNDTTPNPGYISETSNNWRVYASQVPGTVAVYQVSNGTDHMLTTDPAEGASGGYSLAGTLGYAATPNAFSAAGLPASRICRYYCPLNGDHFTYLETVVEDYVKEGCYLFVWDFH